MERRLVDEYIVCKMDLEAASSFLNEVLEKSKERMQNEANYKSFLGKAILEKEEERNSVLTTCKENLDFVIDVLKEYINQESTQPNSTLSYKPRKFILHSDLGKYQTEVIKVKKKIDTLRWTASMTGNEEKKALYQECIERLNYVYSHIAKKS
ncbi:MAG: hypothetical protein J5661_02295 [Bacteroidaceae bacterium]|nr:hypothetical protein [Bacteroidaceae bacterium]